MTLSVWFVLTPNVLMLDYAGPAEAMRMAAEMGGDWWSTPVRRCRACGLHWEWNFSDWRPADATAAQQPGDRDRQCLRGEDYARPEAQAVVAWLRGALQPDTQVASICSGALLLAAAGLLDGRGAPRTTV
jgi:transcriptional regulator GlxA family with amidase domain